ncbi:MAG: BrnT family toxin [Bacilli bacterium]
MKIKKINIPPSREDHFWQAHQVTKDDVIHLFDGGQKNVFLRVPDKQSESDGTLLKVLGRGEDGRYLTVIFRLYEDFHALVITARDMDDAERRLYGRRK